MPTSRPLERLGKPRLFIVFGKPSRSSILLHVTITSGYLACVFLRLVCKLKLKTELIQIAHCLEQAGIDYALCGGLAVAAHGYPRMTKDIDLLIESKEVDSSHIALSSINYDLNSGLIPFDIGTERERKVYRISKAQGRDLVTLDLIVVTPILQDVWDSRELVEVDSIAIKIVSKDGLIKMKRLAGRLQDLADIEALERIQ